MRTSLLFLVFFIAAVCALGEAASEVEEPARRLARADKPGYLPRPTPPRPVFNNRPKREAESDIPEAAEKQGRRVARADKPGYLPRPTPPRPIH